jgi:hypothetical protein
LSSGSTWPARRCFRCGYSDLVNVSGANVVKALTVAAAFGFQVLIRST